ncbi:MAG TPA: rRNA maturation RNase YbeY [Ilumatobacteraceae bacterium]
MTIVVSDEQTDVDIDADRWADLAGAVLEAEGRTGELTLTFVDTDEITALNTEHMGIGAPTDVLSFPLDADDDEMPAGGAVPRLLGDVVVCPAVAAAAAPSHAGTVADELALLVVHGVLHVLGYDHAEHDQAVAMRTRERALLEAHHWAGPAPAGFVHEQS